MLYKRRPDLGTVRAEKNRGIQRTITKEKEREREREREKRGEKSTVQDAKEG